MKYIWLYNFEGTGKKARVSLEALIQKNNNKYITGKISQGKIKNKKSKKRRR